MSALKQGLGTVDPYLGAADMTGFIRSQEGDEVTNLLRRPGLPADERNVALGILDRDLTSSFSALVLSPISVLICTRTDHIQPDLVWPEFHGKHLG
jgi:hypothetical protein